MQAAEPLKEGNAVLLQPAARPLLRGVEANGSSPAQVEEEHVDYE